MSLAERLAREIAAGGPIPVSRFMSACLHDPAQGYYATRPALGAAGDFITAPHVSQMFGELLGLWAAEVWSRLGRPPRVRFVELGPGDGTMMTDVLRAARVSRDFLAALEVWMVETSAPLRQAQRAALASRSLEARWVAAVEDLPSDAPVILLANEFLDCLPIDQALRAEDGWRERRVGLDEESRLEFTTGALLAPLHGQGEGRTGSILEFSPALLAMGRAVGALVARASGAALFFDYGGAAGEFGDTLQALRGHMKEGPLECPGAADLTAHVDFPAFLAAAKSAGARVTAVRLQGEFLRDLGIEARAAALMAANPDRAETTRRQLDRLIGEDQMGQLFKAACVHSTGVKPPAFEMPA